MPIFLSFAILDLASLPPPSTIAPAWPIRLSGGAETRGNVGDKRHIRIPGAFCFEVPAHLADQHHCLCLRVLCESLQNIRKGLANHRVTADPDDGTLPDAGPCQFIDNFVGERPAPGDHPTWPRETRPDLAPSPSLLLRARGDPGSWAQSQSNPSSLHRQSLSSCRAPGHARL